MRNNQRVILAGAGASADLPPKRKTLTFSGKYLRAIEADYTHYVFSGLDGSVMWPEDEEWKADLGKSGNALYPIMAATGRLRPVAEGEKFLTLNSKADPDNTLLGVGAHEYFKAPRGKGSYTIKLKCTVHYANPDFAVGSQVLGAYNLMSLIEPGSSTPYISIEQQLQANGKVKTLIRAYDYHSKSNLATYEEFAMPSSIGEPLEYILTVMPRSISFEVKNIHGDTLGTKRVMDDISAYNDNGNTTLVLLDARAAKWLRDREVRVHDLEIEWKD